MAERKHYLKYGGVEFTAKAPAEAINAFVAALPPHRRQSLFEVARELQAAGMIEIPPDAAFTTRDEDFLRYQARDEREIHGETPASTCPACGASLPSPDRSRASPGACPACGAARPGLGGTVTPSR